MASRVTEPLRSCSSPSSISPDRLGGPEGVRRAVARASRWSAPRPAPERWTSRTCGAKISERYGRRVRREPHLPGRRRVAVRRDRPDRSRQRRAPRSRSSTRSRSACWRPRASTTPTSPAARASRWACTRAAAATRWASSRRKDEERLVSQIPVVIEGMVETVTGETAYARAMPERVVYAARDRGEVVHRLVVVAVGHLQRRLPLADGAAGHAAGRRGEHAQGPVRDAAPVRGARGQDAALLGDPLQRVPGELRRHRASRCRRSTGSVPEADPRRQGRLQGVPAVRQLGALLHDRGPLPGRASTCWSKRSRRSSASRRIDEKRC